MVQKCFPCHKHILRTFRIVGNIFGTWFCLIEDGEFAQYRKEFEKAFEVDAEEEDEKTDSKPIDVVKSMCESRKVGNLVLKHCGIPSPVVRMKILKSLKKLLSSEVCWH